MALWASVLEGRLQVKRDLEVEREDRPHTERCVLGGSRPLVGDFERYVSKRVPIRDGCSSGVARASRSLPGSASGAGRR